MNLWETFFKTVFRWRMEELAEQARLSPVDFRAELTSRLKEDNFSDSLENLLEDVDDDEEEEGGDSVESYNEQMREQSFGNNPSHQFLDYFAPHAVVQNQNFDQTTPENGHSMEFQSIESDLKNMGDSRSCSPSVSVKGPLDDLENIDDLNVLDEITQNMQQNNGTSCIMINDTLNETTSSAEVLKEISEKMTTELLGFFGSESIPEEPAEVAQVEQKSQRKGQKRLLPSWMKVGNADPKHFKLDQAEEAKKEEMSAAEFSAAVAKENSEFNASCDLCDFRDPNRKNVMKHRNAEHKNLPFQCKVCGKTFKVAQGLVTHRQNIHMKQLVRQPR